MSSNLSLTRSDLIERASLLASLCSEFQFKISKPATEKQVAWRQKQINRPLPEQLTNFALRVASRVSIVWEFDPKKVEHLELEKDIEGSGDFEFNFFATDLTNLEGWEPSFSNWQEYRSEPNPFEYDDLFPIFNVANGDLIVTIIGEKDHGAVYYLSHEGGDGDWQRLADSYEQFLSTLADLWFPSLDWDNSLELFYDEERKIVSADCQLARKIDNFIRNKA